ncbi:hypothetical protein ELH75_07085 [Rhizobium leguminosarum]|nr:hypothetical protein [Rhizobium leguminosarum bv. viciae]TAZ60998.1 hypothetical protein ELH75_07085 [Rhizobium leguminosarum]
MPASISGRFRSAASSRNSPAGRCLSSTSSNSDETAIGRINPADLLELQRRASFQTRKGRCNTLNCCIILSLNRFRFKELCSRHGSDYSLYGKNEDHCAEKWIVRDCLWTECAPSFASPNAVTCRWSQESWVSVNPP